MRIQFRYRLIYVLLIAGLFGNLANAGEAGKPSAFVEEPVYQFGSVIEGDDIVHEFKIQNKGTAELRIERVESG
jgi:hypothetical protein